MRMGETHAGVKSKHMHGLPMCIIVVLVLSSMILEERSDDVGSWNLGGLRARTTSSRTSQIARGRARAYDAPEGGRTRGGRKA